MRGARAFACGCVTERAAAAGDTQHAHELLQLVHATQHTRRRQRHCGNRLHGLDTDRDAEEAAGADVVQAARQQRRAEVELLG